jgi:type IV fimbrial biogenesis protein FimT
MRTGQHGVTLVELMVVILLIAILSGFAVPGFQQYTRNSRAIAAQNDLVTAISVARSEALKRSAAVTVCASSNGTSCTGTATTWANGWIVFTDATGTAGVVDAGANGDQVLQRWLAPGGTTTFTASAAYMQFQPIGSAQFPGASPASFDLAWTGCHGHFKRRLTLFPVGSPQSETKDCP